MNLLTPVGQAKVEIQEVTSGTENASKKRLRGSAGRVRHQLHAEPAVYKKLMPRALLVQVTFSHCSSGSNTIEKLA